MESREQKIKQIKGLISLNEKHIADITNNILEMNEIIKNLNEEMELLISHNAKLKNELFGEEEESK